MKIIIFFALTFSMRVAADNSLLNELYIEDQGQRSGQSYQRTDTDRRRLVMQQLAQGQVRSAKDQFAAAMVLQHTGLTFCEGKLIGSSPENYLLAHELFKQALVNGEEEARYFVAASLDRYLTFTEGFQKYGTNRLYNQKTESEEWAPIDRNTSDEERAEYGVPPLNQLLKMHPEQKRDESKKISN